MNPKAPTEIVLGEAPIESVMETFQRLWNSMQPTRMSGAQLEAWAKEITKHTKYIGGMDVWKKING